MGSDYVQSLIRAIDIIETLQDGPMGLMDISKAVSLNKSTVHRLISTLIYKGYIIQDEISGQYRLSLKFLELGNNSVKDMGIIDFIKPYLQSLASKTNEVIHLVLIEDLDIVYIDKIETDSNIRMHSYIGKRTPLYSSAVGKAHMADLDQESFDELWQKVAPKITKLTPNTIISKDKMIEELALIKNRGYAIDHEENEEGVVCVAATLNGQSNGPAYAISISTPIMRITEEKLHQFGNLLQATIEDITKNLSHIL